MEVSVLSKNISLKIEISSTEESENISIKP